MVTDTVPPPGYGQAISACKRPRNLARSALSLIREMEILHPPILDTQQMKH
jgi:hypothetical protein